jgi:hypothetical protein
VYALVIIYGFLSAPYRYRHYVSTYAQKMSKAGGDYCGYVPLTEFREMSRALLNLQQISLHIYFRSMQPDMDLSKATGSALQKREHCCRKNEVDKGG